MGFLDIEQATLPVPDYTYITREEEARKALEVIAKYPVIEVDTEGTSLDPYGCKTTLLQIGLPNDIYIFDLRHDLPDVDIHGSLFKDILTSKNTLKLLQNANYDLKVLKAQYGFYIENIYDTMIAEQLLHLGIKERGFSLANLVAKYLNMQMDKEPRKTFSDYYQEFTHKQLSYAATDVCILDIIRHGQLPNIDKYDLWEVLQLEMDFLKPMAEMELNGITLDVDKWRIIMGEAEKEMLELKADIERQLTSVQDQATLFGVSTINIASPAQLLDALNKIGISVKNTDVATLSKYKGHPVIDAILSYRKLYKLVTTYGEAVIERIHPVTGRLHTAFKQMVSTGRMSSNNPNLQNIPGKQKFRSCFIAKPGYVLITVDQNSAELAIMGDMSDEQNFIETHRNKLDLHTVNASRIFNVDYEVVTKEQRKASKSISFGLAYGISAVGLARRLKISDKEAQDLIYKYFEVNSALKSWLERSAKEAVKNKYSKTITGRCRFYNIPDYNDPQRKRVIGSVQRAAKNHRIQGCMVSGTYIKGVGYIEDYVGKTIKLETGFGKDTATGVFSGEKEVYDLKLNNGITLGITEDHKIPVVNDEGLVDKKVKDLTEEDYLLIPLNRQEGNVTDISNYKYSKSKRTFTDVDLPTKVTKELSFVIGCLIGDGCYSTDNTIAFYCCENQKELFIKYNKYIEKLFKYKPKISKVIGHRKSYLYSSCVNSVVIKDFLKYLGLTDVVNINKSIPKYFFTETVENKGALLNGLFSTGGGIHTAPSYTTPSKELAEDIHNLLFSLGINSNLKTYIENGVLVYKIQIFNRFNKCFKKYVDFSVNYKKNKLDENLRLDQEDRSDVPAFIPKLIEKCLRRSKTFFDDFNGNEKAQLRSFKIGCSSFKSWRYYYNFLPECEEKQFLSKFLEMDFCKIKSLTYRGVEPTYDLVCDNIHYFIANGVVVHNSDADTIKKAMILCLDKLEKSGIDAKLLLSVHDEIVVEAPEDRAEEVAKIVTSAVDEGFNSYFNKMPMTTDAVIGPCWIKSECTNKVDGKECGHNVMTFVKDDHYGTMLVCKKCGAAQY